ncbi:MAG: 3-deoxy-D-manno-octulosonic acid transferase [Chitinophagaceae bacterium]
MSLLFYNIFLWLYKMGIYAASLWNKKAAKWIAGRKNIFQKIENNINTDRPVIWFHCASLGEFEQGRPLMEKLRKEYSQHSIVLSFFSPSGYEVRKNYAGADYVFYLPYDSKKNAARLLNLLKPALVVFVKYDLWYYYLYETGKRNIPLLLVSSVFRRQQSFFKWHGAIQRRMIRFFTHIFVQNEESKLLLKKAGIEKCSVGSDTRFDRVAEIAEQFRPIAEIEKFLNGKKAIVAGSTWKEDELQLHKISSSVFATGCKLIIAPHEIDESNLSYIQSLFPNAVLFSCLQKEAAHANCLVIDNIGMLAQLYKYAWVSYVGGGYTKDGVHNVLEPAVYGKPVVFGPNYSKYREAIDLVKSKAAFSFSDAQQLQEILNSLLNNQQLYATAATAAGDYVKKNKGATEKIIAWIQAKRLLTN